jgi:hypothetical protein
MSASGDHGRTQGLAADGTGTPHGPVISPLLANLDLNPPDHAMAGRGWEMGRYADDFVVLGRTQAQAQAVLTLHPAKTRMVNAAAHHRLDHPGQTLRFRHAPARSPAATRPPTI